MSADSSEFRKTAENIEKAKDGPPKELLAKIKDYISRPREVHEETRKTSLETPTSIIGAILGDSLNAISIEQHAQCLEYFSASLAARDRDEITKALCRQKPGLFLGLLVSMKSVKRFSIEETCSRRSTFS